MGNEKLGHDFEKQLCELLAKGGWWAKFLPPEKDGSQPFDIVALKRGISRVWTTYCNYALIDCKTCSTRHFPLSRVEDNQQLSFRSLEKKGLGSTWFAILFKNKIYFFRSWTILRAMEAEDKSIDIMEYYDEMYDFEQNLHTRRDS